MSNFNKGDRVKMSALGLQRLRQGRIGTGYVLGTVMRQPSNWASTMAIQIDGTKSISSYHRSFWEHIDAAMRGDGTGGLER